MPRQSPGMRMRLLVAGMLVSLFMLSAAVVVLAGSLAGHGHVAPAQGSPVLPAAPSGAGWEAEATFVAEQNAQRRGPDGPVLRDQVEAPGRSAGQRLRVMLVGDSWMSGAGLVDMDALPGTRLRRAMEQLTAPGAVDVLTVALPAASTVEQAQWLASGLVEEYDPDVVVLAYNVNDVVPSGREDALCPEAEQPCQGLVVEMSQEYRDCIAGKGISAVAAVVSDELPGLSLHVEARACDPAALAARTGMLTFEDLMSRPAGTRYWQPFLEAANDLAGVAGRVPVLVAPVDSHGSAASTAPLQALRATGLPVAEMPRANQVLDLMRADKAYWASPGDAHPGAAWTQAFAEDVSAGALSLIGSSRRQEAVSAAEAQPEPLVTGFLPVSAKVDQEPGVARIEVPAGTGQCLPMGLPHATVLLASGLPQGKALAVSLAAGRAGLWLIRYDAKGQLAYEQAGELVPGSDVEVRTGDGLRGLAFSQDSPCGRPAPLQPMKAEVRLTR